MNRPARGARQHYLPAAYIGGFSEETSGRRRKRTVLARRRGRAETFLKRSEDLAWASDFYTLSGAEDDPYFVDRMWDRVEQNLAAAIDALRMVPDEPLDALLWAYVLVGFVTDLFVRSPD